MQYTRNELDFKRGTFRAKGDVVEIYPSSKCEKVLLELNSGVMRLRKFQKLIHYTGKAIALRPHVLIYPNSQYVTSKEKLAKAIVTIEEEMKERVDYFKAKGKLNRSSKN